MAALASEGHKTPTPIQSDAIPLLLKGNDLLGMAQTGTGKTAAFALPILHRLYEAPAGRRSNAPRALILAPTRELAGQVKERFSAYGARTGLSVGLVIGGAPIGKQKNMLRRGVDILVATPGRLEDLMKQRAVSLDAVEVLVLDEVDQMLDMGFIHAIRAITGKLPKDRQSLFFSATMPREIKRLAQALLNDPVHIEVKPSERPKIDQSVLFITKPEKLGALIKVINDDAFKSGLVFSRTKHGADKVVRNLRAEGVSAQAIHGNRSQGQRERALKDFKSGNACVLVATDIAARGIDVKGVTHVVNFDLPNVPETYVHRIGRTGRAGATGIAISFCSPEERGDLRAIEKLTGEQFGATGGRDSYRSDDNKKPRAKRSPRHKPRRPAREDQRKPSGDAPRKSQNGTDGPAFNKAGAAATKKVNDNGERGTPRVRRRRRRSAA